MLIGAAKYLPVDPATYWVPLVSALIVGALSFVGVLLVSLRSGTSLKRTIKANREAQILEHRLPLYADILMYVVKRRQHREVLSALIKVNGATQLDPFDQEGIFDILGRAHALADADVLKAFDAADDADMKVQRSVNFQTITQGEPNMAAERAKRMLQMFEEKERANAADAVLETAIRKSLHRDEAPAIQPPEAADEQLDGAADVSAEN